MPNNAIGTVIENQAAIYFDFNAPIFTNTTFHTVDTNFIQIINGTSHVPAGFGELLVYPNPSAGDVLFELPSNAPSDAIFTLHDQLGRQVVRGDFAGRQYRFTRGGLADGVYFYRVEVEGVGAYSGKVVLK